MTDDANRIDLGDGFHLGPAYAIPFGHGPAVPHRDLFYDRGDGSDLHRVGAASEGLMALWIGKRPFRGYRHTPYARCSTCTAPLDVPGRPWSENCGGDCIACMADAGDPECVEAVAAMRAGEAVVKAGEVSAGLAMETLREARGDGTAATGALYEALKKAQAEGKSKATPKHVSRPAPDLTKTVGYQAGLRRAVEILFAAGMVEAGRRVEAEIGG